MSAVAPVGEVPDAPAKHSENTNRICQIPEKGWESLWVWASERINPIVVKEVRQSLKSKQFTFSFGLTLIAAIGWTMIAVSMMVPAIFYLPGGATLLVGFMCILALPLMVIIPFSAFRSLTSETEDSTFELLSISALTSHQIIYGKMASACLQIVLYLSALAPCIMLTYLLRGVSLISIGLVLGITVLFSVCETAVALLLASISRSRMVSTGVSVIALTGLIGGFFAWTGVIVESGLDLTGPPSSQDYVWFIAILSVVAMAIGLVLRAAAAAIDFPSENHSTSLRWWLLGLIGLYLFWMLMFLCIEARREVATIIQLTLFAFLMFIGALMCGERGVISLRAQRTLPRTFLGRVFFSWFYPGAGLGYVFVVCIFASIATVLASLEMFAPVVLKNLTGNGATAPIGYLLTCYLAIYLGFNRLAMLWLDKTMPTRMLGSVALLIVILLILHLVPYMLALMINDYNSFPYAWHQALNIYLTCTQANNRLSLDLAGSAVIVTLCAAAIFGLNLLLSTRDIMLVRVALPPRVREEEGLSEAGQEPSVDPFAD